MDPVLNAWLDADEVDTRDLTPSEYRALLEDDWAQELLEPALSLKLYSLCRMTDWRHLPEPGGLLEQHDTFLHDAMIINQRLGVLRRNPKRTRRRARGRSKNRMSRHQARLEKMKAGRRRGRR